jgi:hypothetical protein
MDPLKNENKESVFSSKMKEYFSKFPSKLHPV